MGLSKVVCLLENQQDRTRSVQVPDVVVDTCSELTWISREHLARIGIEPEKRQAVRAGQWTADHAPIGFAVIRVGEELTTDEVMFAETGDLQLLGACTLEGLNMKVDSRSKKLVAAGPLMAAGNARSSGTDDQ